MQSEIADDPYAILGVPRTVTADELKRAYRKLSMAWHPDRHANASDAKQREAASRFKLINSAYVAIGEILRGTAAGDEAGNAAGQAAAVVQADTWVEAIRSVVTSAALRVVPNLPRHAFRRVIGVVEQLLLDTIALGEQAFAGGFEAAFRDAMYTVGMDGTLRGEALKVLDVAADELQWRGKGADPETWQTLLQPLERARGITDLAPTPSPSTPATTEQTFQWESLLRTEPALVVAQGALAFLVLLLLLPMVPMGGTIRGILLLGDLVLLGYITFGPRSA